MASKLPFFWPARGLLAVNSFFFVFWLISYVHTILLSLFLNFKNLFFPKNPLLEIKNKFILKRKMDSV